MDVLWFQEDFVSDENKMLNRQLDVEKEYLNGPERLFCILCSSPLSLSRNWYKRGALQYTSCATCGHLNGGHLETDEFLAYAYTDVESRELTKPYFDEYKSGKMFDDFELTVERIYLPKANFLRDVLLSKGMDIASVKLVDFGCGAGHFISALQKVGFKNIVGIETLQSALDISIKNGINSKILKLIDHSQTLNFLREVDCEVVTMLCVLPHLREPLKALEALKENVKCIATFQKLPKWSYASSLESIFPESRARVLGSDHTSVFSNESVRWVEKYLELNVWGEWKFGSDYLDLFRKLIIKSQGVEMSEEFREALQSQWMQIADQVQEVIDNNDQSSELHIVWATKN